MTNIKLTFINFQDEIYMKTLHTQFGNIAFVWISDILSFFFNHFPVCFISANKNWHIELVLLTYKFKNKQVLQNKLFSTMNIYRDIFSNIHPRSVLT